MTREEKRQRLVDDYERLEARSLEYYNKWLKENLGFIYVKVPKEPTP